MLLNNYKNVVLTIAIIPFDVLVPNLAFTYCATYERSTPGVTGEAVLIFGNQFKNQYLLFFSFRWAYPHQTFHLGTVTGDKGTSDIAVVSVSNQISRFNTSYYFQFIKIVDTKLGININLYNIKILCVFPCPNIPIVSVANIFLNTIFQICHS